MDTQTVEPCVLELWTTAPESFCWKAWKTPDLVSEFFLAPLRDMFCRMSGTTDRWTHDRRNTQERTNFHHLDDDCQCDPWTRCAFHACIRVGLD